MATHSRRVTTPDVGDVTVLRANHVAMSVSDMTASLAFYSGILGLEQVGRNPTVERIPGYDRVVGMPNFRAEWALLRLGDTGLLELMCYARPRGRPVRADHRPADLGNAHLAIEVDDVRRWWPKLDAAGVETLSPPIDLGRHVTFFARGPDREIVEILEERAPLPEQWST